MKVLSLFDWISCARVALGRAGFTVDTYYASEVDKYAIQIAQKNYPNTSQVWDVSKIVTQSLGGVPIGLMWFSKFDLLIWGSPCQDLSIAKKNRKWLDWERSGLFREYVRILQDVKPKRFILENVNSMPKEARQTITETLGVEPIMINASLVSAQNRKRLFWTNIPWVTQPEDRGILLKDILQDGAEVDERMVVNWKSFAITASYNWAVERNSVAKRQRTMVRVGQFGKWWQWDRVYSPEWKSVALSALWGGRWAKTWLYYIKQRARWYNKWGIHAEKSPTLSSNSRQENNKLVGPWSIRKLTPIECERLQGLPDNYTDGISNTQRYKCLGNAFNVDVVAHILSFIPKE